MNEALRKVSGREVLVQVRSYRKIISPLFCKWFDEIVTFPLCKVVIKSIISIWKEPCCGTVCIGAVIVISIIIITIIIITATAVTIMLAAAIITLLWRRTRVPEEGVLSATGSSQRLKCKEKNWAVPWLRPVRVSKTIHSHAEVWTNDFKAIMIPIA